MKANEWDDGTPLNILKDAVRHHRWGYLLGIIVVAIFCVDQFLH